MDEELTAEKQADQVERIRKYQWKKGQSGNPDGRPPSPVKRIKEMFKENPEEFDEWVKDYLEDRQNKKHVVEMIDGKPQANVDLTTGGESINQVLVKFIDDKTTDSGDTN